MNKPTNNTTRRHLLTIAAGGAVAAALPIAAALPVAAPAMDFPVAPVTPQPARTACSAASAAIEAVERFRKASRLFDRCSMKLSKARDEAEEKHGRQPDALIHWRNSFIGGSALNWKRKSLLIGGEEDPATIELEYRDAKKRYRSAVKAATDWEKRVGLEALCASMEQARIEFFAAGRAFSTVALNSVADASALLELIRPEYGGIEDWEIAALNNASKYLADSLAGKSRCRSTA
jgi:hypothetical protein